MSITEKMRKVFDACTVMAGVDPDFECVYMTKGVALLYLDEIDAENARLREQVDAAHMSRLLTENENEKLRELAVGMYVMLEMVDKMLGNHDACETPRPLIFGEDKSFKDVMRELRVEVLA